jgi:ADP-heptose:LPS heptosyltransferase
MQREDFDLAFQLHGGGRHSNPFVRRLGARVTIGTRTPDAAPLDRWIEYVYFQQEVLRMLEVVALAGARINDLEPHLKLTPADLADAERVVPELAKPLVALHPGASDPERIWPADRFAAVGDALAAAGAQVVVTGAQDECQRVRAVVEGMRSDAWDLAGRLSLHGLAGLLARCSVVVSNDTGPLHLAAAVGTATVGVYWCFNALTAGPISRARHRPAIAWRVTCPVCGIDRSQLRCSHHPSFVADVSAAEVIASAVDLLDAEQAEAALPGAVS